MTNNIIQSSLENIRKESNRSNYDNVLDKLEQLRREIVSKKSSELGDEFNTNLPQLPKAGYKVQSELGVYTEKLRILEELLILRDIYRQGWLPRYEKENFAIIGYRATLGLGSFIYHKASDVRDRAILSFPTEKVAEQFKSEFNPLINEVLDLIG